MFQIYKNYLGGKKTGKHSVVDHDGETGGTTAKILNNTSETWRRQYKHTISSELKFIKPLHFPFPLRTKWLTLTLPLHQHLPLILHVALRCSWSYQAEGNSLAITVLWPSICQKDALWPSRCKGVNLSTLMVPESCDQEVPWNTRYSRQEMEMIIRRSIYARRKQNDRVRGQSSSISPGIKDWHAESEKPFTTPHLTAHTHSSI